MFCTKCSAELRSGVKFCVKCGAAVKPPMPQPFVQPNYGSQPSQGYQPVQSFRPNIQPNGGGYPQQPPVQSAPVMPPQPPVAYFNATVQEAPMAYSEPPIQEAPMAYSEPPMQEAPVAYSEPPVQEAPMAYSEPPVQEAPMAYFNATVQEAPVAYSEPPIQETPEIYDEQPVQETPEPVPTEKRKGSPLKIIIPVAAAVLVLGAVGIFVLPNILGGNDTSPSLVGTDEATIEQAETADIRDLTAKLNVSDYEGAYAIAELLDDDDCEDAIDEHLEYLYDNFAPNVAERRAELMFDAGFSRLREIYDKYRDGAYAPVQTTTPATTTTAPMTSSTEPEVTEPTVEAEIPLEEQIIGQWRKKLDNGVYERVVFIDDGTGYIVSDIVKENRSDTNPRYYYYDGKIHFTWKVIDDKLIINAEYDPYCFVAYQGYSGPGHQSNATWRGKKNGSHDYIFAYDTKTEYLSDMLGISSLDDINEHACLTRTYWSRFIKTCDVIWPEYFDDVSKYLNLISDIVDYSKIENDYKSDPELRAKYEDVDLYHFVLFTEALLQIHDYDDIALEFDMEEYEYVN